MKYDTENNLLRLKTEKTHENVCFMHSHINYACIFKSIISHSTKHCNQLMSVIKIKTINLSTHTNINANIVIRKTD